MAHGTNRLSETKIKRGECDRPGVYADGNNLYLRVQGDAKSWLMIFNFEKKRYEMALGPLRLVNLALAREKAQAARDMIARGINPHTYVPAPEPTKPTVAEILTDYVATFSPARSATVTKRWLSMFRIYGGELNDMPIDAVTTAHVEAALKPIWHLMPESAKYYRAMIEKLIAFATIKGHVPERPNPARWANHLELIMTPQDHTPTHHAAMPYEIVPDFYAELTDRATPAAHCLQFVILTITRQAEARLMTWDEVDLKAGLWVIPKHRTKTRREHVVTLTPQAVDLLKRQHALTDGEGWVWPGQKEGQALSHMALASAMNALDADAYTVHGFRSAYRDWMSECTSHPTEIAEMNLAHTVGTASERAYKRTLMLKKRLAALDDWATYLKA